MKHFANKSQTWFKVLDAKARSLDQEPLNWQLPHGNNKGDWMVSPLPCGTLLVSNPGELLKFNNRAFVVEFREEPVSEYPGVIWVKKLRLVREASSMDLKRFGIYHPQTEEL